MFQKNENKVKITKDRHGKTYFWCSCHGHLVTIWWDEEFDWDTVELSFWESPRARYGWREKLKHIWQIIRYGTPYSDHILFDADEAELFIETMQEYVDKAKVVQKKNAKADQKKEEEEKAGQENVDLKTN